MLNNLWIPSNNYYSTITSDCDESDVGARQVFPQIVERPHEVLLVLLRSVLCRFEAGLGAEVVVADENRHQLQDKPDVRHFSGTHTHMRDLYLKGGYERCASVAMSEPASKYLAKSASKLRRSHWVHLPGIVEVDAGVGANACDQNLRLLERVVVQSGRHGDIESRVWSLKCVWIRWKKRHVNKVGFKYYIFKYEWVIVSM
jgi:hypothetical protein